MKFSTLFLSILVGASMAADCNRAFACGSNCTDPLPQDPSLTQHQAIGDTSAAAKAKAEANAGAKSDLNADLRTSSSAASDGGSSNLTDASRTKALALGLGSFTMAPLPYNGCNESDPEYKRLSVAGGLLFDASHQQTHSLCGKTKIRNDLAYQCRFKDAYLWEQQIMLEVYPAFAFDPKQADLYINRPPQECKAGVWTAAKAIDPNKVVEENPPAAGPSPKSVAKTGPCEMKDYVRNSKGVCHHKSLRAVKPTCKLVCAGSK